MVMRLNIGSPQPAAPPPGSDPNAPRFNFLGPVEPPPGGSAIPVGWQPAEGDPFAPKAPAFQTGPVQAPAGTGQGGSGGAWSPVDFDPFEARNPNDPKAIGTPGIVDAQAPEVPDAGGMGGPGGTGKTPYMYSQGTEKGFGYTQSPAWQPGILPGQSTVSTFGEADVPVEEPGPEMGSRTGTPKTKPAPGTELLTGLGKFLADYLQVPLESRTWGDRAAQVIDNAPPGTRETVPNMDFGSQAAIERVKKQVMETPVQRGGMWGDGSSVGNGPAPGSSLGYDTHGDVYGGEASNLALLGASLIPLRTQEQLEKRIAILSADLGVPADRFFTKDGQIKYIDLSGKTFAVAPSVEGGTWKAPIDKLERISGAVASEAGQGIPMATGAAGGMLAGPEAYAPSAMAGAAAAAAVGDFVRQLAGNYTAQQAGYKGKPGNGVQSDIMDIDWWNVAGQAAQNMGFEAFARFMPAFLGQLPPRLFGQNPYRLTGVEAQDLARVLYDDLEHGGEIMRRAENAHRLGINLTPRDLLQITKNVLGSSANVSSQRSRLFQSLSQHEATLATLKGKRGSEAAGIMQNFYRWRSRVEFPNAVQKLVRMISGEEIGPAAAFKEFKGAAQRVQAYLERKRNMAGYKAGWDVLFKSNARADAAPVVKAIDARFPNTAGPIRQELEKLRGELVDSKVHIPAKGGTPINRTSVVDNYERLHQVRLGLDRKIEALKHGAHTPEGAQLQAELETMRDLLKHQLNNNPLYGLGDQAHAQASVPINDAKRGILDLLKEDPIHQVRQGGGLADSGPTVIAAARKMFAEAGEGAAWDAHTRAYLETHLRTAGGAGGMNTSAQGGAHQPGLNFANEVASQPNLHAGLMEMVTHPEHRELLDSLIDAGYAFDQANRGVNDVITQAMAPNPRRLNPNGTNIFGKIAGALTPIQAIIARSRGIQEYLDTRGAATQAFNLTQGSKKAYAEMTDYSVPLAGPKAEKLERALYAAAPWVQQQTDWIPRPSPAWLIQHGIPWLTPPPERDANARDLKPVPQSALSRFLGPSP
jgi:hypothetical protein